MKYQEFGFIEAIKLIKYELGNLTAEPVHIFFFGCEPSLVEPFLQPEPFIMTILKSTPFEKII